MKKVLDFVPSILLGALFLFGGIGYFIPMGELPKMVGDAGKYYTLLDASGIMRVVKVLEIVGGALILIPSKRALGLTILAPITVNILLFELCLEGSVKASIGTILLSAIIAYQEREKFKALL